VQAHQALKMGFATASIVAVIASVCREVMGSGPAGFRASGRTRREFYHSAGLN
jgi:hypothetical protein